MLILKVFLICWIISTTFFFFRDVGLAVYHNNQISNFIGSVFTGGIISIVSAICASIWMYM